MIAFVDDHRGQYGVEPICRELRIAPSTYHTHAARRADPSKVPPRARRDAVLCAEIHRVWAENFGMYGVRKSGGSSAARGSTWRDAPWRA